MIPLFKVATAPEAVDMVADVIRSDRLSHGPKVEEFEAELRARIGNPHLAVLNNGTSGLQLALRLVTGPGPGGPDGDPGEVLTTPFTFEATNWAILANGLRLRWVDVDPATLNIDLDDLAKKISPVTRAIVVVHWGGYPVDLDRLAEILDDAESRYGFRPRVIEDCAHAWGTRLRGRLLGNDGNICMFSFHAIKHLSCGIGGALAFPDEEFHQRARRMRFFGIDRTADRATGDYDVPEWGYNFYMDDIHATIGLANLPLVADRIERHRRNAAFFDGALAGVPGLGLTGRRLAEGSSFWLYPVLADDRAGFMRKLTGAGIVSSMVIKRNDVHSCVRDAATPLPGLESVADRVVHIPVGWWLSEADRAHIADTIKSGW